MDLGEILDSNFRGAVYVVQDNKVLCEKVSGFADLLNEIPNSIDTRFASASAGKVFVAVGILQLIEQGRLNFDDIIGNTTDRAEKGEVKGARYIIVIQSVVCYNFSIVDSDKSTNGGWAMEKKVFSKCGNRCDLCLLYRPNVEKNDRRKDICNVYSKIFPGYNADPHTIICDGCSCEKENAVLQDPMCKTRKCVIEKGFEHCGYCGQYPCDIFPAEPTHEELVQKIEVEKQWTWEDEKLMEAYNCKKNIDEFRRNK